MVSSAAAAFSVTLDSFHQEKSFYLFLIQLRNLSEFILKNLISFLILSSSDHEDNFCPFFVVIFNFPKLIYLLIYSLLPKLPYLFFLLILARFLMKFKIKELLLLFLIAIVYERNVIVKFLAFLLDHNLCLAFLSILSFQLVCVDAKDKKN